MDDNELDKTFVERSPLSLVVPSAFGGVPQVNTRPVVGQTRFGPNVVTEVIGEGGMATVYKVWNERLEVFRAVKLLSHEAFSDRFETEAKITAKLHHAGIVEIHNIGEWNGLPYMEMEFVDGSDLQQMLAAHGKLPGIICVTIATRVAEALTHAHTKTFTLVGKQYCGIIHRDLKPANIMISKHGEVKLTDFGIARPTQTSLHTVEGNIAGTMHYLSPEQMNGGDVDNRSDIYSFGTILYEMVTGAKTFPQESVIELMKQKSANKFKPVNEYGIPVNTNFLKIMLRCLKFTPDKRYQRTQELVDDLRELNESMTKQAPTDVLKNYLNGTDEADYAESCKTKTLWILGKKRATETPDNSETTALPTKPTTPEPERELKPAESSAMPSTSEPKEEQKSEEISANLKPTMPPKKPKIADKSTILTKSLREILTTLRPIFSKRKTLIAPLVLLAILFLSYITTKLVTVNAVTTKPAPRPATDATPKTILDTSKPLISANTKIDSTTAKTVKSIGNTVPLPPKTLSADTWTTEPKKISVPAATTPSKTTVTSNNPTSEDEQLRAALTASNAKNWDRAIEILEQDGVYKVKNDLRTLYLLNAYVESRRFDKAQALIDAAPFTLSQDAYFNLCAGKFLYYKGAHSKALKYFELSVNNVSVMNTDNVLPGASLYFIADIKQKLFNATPSAISRSSVLEAWRDVRTAFILKSDDPRAKRAEREISALDGNPR
jgi:serine/threonine protein kinase